MMITSDHGWPVASIEDLRAWREAGYPGKAELTPEFERQIVEVGATNG